MLVYIPVAGLGSRLTKKSGSLPKPLRSVGSLPMLGRVMELYPEETRFHLTLGYQGDLIHQVADILAKEFHFSITFSETKSWSTLGQGLTQTLVEAASFLQEPFIFHAVDSLLSVSPAEIFEPDTQAILSSYPHETGMYRAIVDGEWRHSRSDEESPSYAYVGVANIVDHESFWDRILEHAEMNPESGETLGIDPLEVDQISLPEQSWIDCGNEEGLQRARRHFVSNDEVLERPDEAIWHINDKMYKLHLDQGFISQRVRRGNDLSPYVPNPILESPNIYSYLRTAGINLSKAPIETFEPFMSHCWKFWNDFTESSSLSFNNISEFDVMHFYEDKTYLRLAEYFQRYPLDGDVSIINGQQVSQIYELLSVVPWDRLAQIRIGRTHGDLHPENVIFDNASSSFTFLDWRQNFAGSTSIFGDIYYDLSKINHGLYVDHGEINKGNFNIEINQSVGLWNIQVPERKKLWKTQFDSFVKIHELDAHKIAILTSLIYLNIAPLHHHPYSRFLYLRGMDLLARSVKKIEY